MEVLRVPPKETYDWLLRVHYAKRIPSMSYAYGLFDGGVPLGYVAFGSPSSAPLRSGIAGPDYAANVIELSRLVFAFPVKNGASFLVSSALRMLPKPSIVVSYADTAQGHIGYVYQACNFIYTGLSAKRTDWKVKGLDRMHGQSVADISLPAKGHGKGARVEFMRQKYGDSFYLEDRARKHRYIYICGTKAQRKKIISSLRYPTLPYPKGDSDRYPITERPYTQPQLEF